MAIMKTGPCPLCLGIGHVPADSDRTQAELVAEIRADLTAGPGAVAFDARVERIRARQRAQQAAG